MLGGIDKEGIPDAPPRKCAVLLLGHCRSLILINSKQGVLSPVLIGTVAVERYRSPEGGRMERRGDVLAAQSVVKRFEC